MTFSLKSGSNGTSCQSETVTQRRRALLHIKEEIFQWAEENKFSVSYLLKPNYSTEEHVFTTFESSETYLITNESIQV